MNANEQRIKADPKVGLTSAQVQDQMRRHLNNCPVDPPSQTVADIIRENVCTYFNLIFAVIAVLLIIAGSFRNLTFLPVIIANTLIGIIQEIRAKKVLDELSMLNVPKVQVVRDGQILKIPSEMAVRDDIIILEAGDQICADAVVLEGDLLVNESLLTGESDEVRKKSGDPLMSGSFVVSGSCRARLMRVGAESYISKLTLEAKKIQSDEQSEMIRALNRLVKWVGILILPLGAVLFGQQFFLEGTSFQESIVSMVAAVIGMIPEGLYLLASVALVVSSMRLARRRVLLHDMKCIETLARVDVLCVDKTGTITENTMNVLKVVETEPYKKKTLPSLDVLIGDFTAAMDNDNLTMKVMKNYFRNNSGKKPVSVTRFSSAVKYSSVTFDDAVYVLGAPEFVLRESYGEYREEIESYGSEGYRVVVFAEYDGAADGKPLTGKATPLGYVLLANPVREDARETFEFFEKQGVTVKVISGDNPVTVSRVAQEAGIANADKYIDAATLAGEEQIANAVRDYVVFGRVTPAQKRKFIQALKQDVHTVAMTGDGVNDVLALKDADCSIAMASGSDAAAQSAQLVLLDSNFSCMTDVVMEGRRVVNNIERSASLFLVKNIFSFLLAILSLCFAFSYPLEPAQVSLISMFNIGVPAFFLAMEPNKNLIQGRFMTNVLLKALPAGLTDVLAVGALVLIGETFEVPAEDISTAATMLLAIVGFMILYRISRPMNKLRWAIWFGCLAGLIFCAVYLNHWFAITGMSKKCIMLFVVFSIATEPVLRYLSMAVEFLRGKLNRGHAGKAGRHSEG